MRDSSRNIYVVLELHLWEGVKLQYGGANIPLSEYPPGIGLLPVFATRQDAEAFAGPDKEILEFSFGEGNVQ